MTSQSQLSRRDFFKFFVAPAGAVLLTTALPEIAFAVTVKKKKPPNAIRSVLLRLASG